MRKGAKHTDAATRLFFMVASAARKAVVLRRGPTKQVQMLCWDLVTDSVMPGQWLSGRVYNEKCDLSPNGKLLVYFAGKFKKDMDTFTAVCRPPYFTALALWPSSGTYGGGGNFVNDHQLVLNYGNSTPELNEGRNIPASFTVLSTGEYQKLNQNNAILTKNRGWVTVTEGSNTYEITEGMWRFTQPWVDRKPHPIHPRLLLQRRWIGVFKVNGPSSVYSYRLIETAEETISAEAKSEEELLDLDWAEWDHDGSLLFAKDGRLWRRRMVRSLRGAQEQETEVADLRDHAFTNVLPPDYARVWP